jgi:hypothetical protein
MLMKICTLLITTLFSGMMLFAQDPPEQPNPKWVHLLHAEAGITFLNSTIKESLAIRQNVSSYYAYQSSKGQISTNTTGYNAALLWEFYHSGKKLGFSTGVRYTAYNTMISGYTGQNADFFFLRYSAEGIDTKFARVKSITEANRFIGIPLEIRYVPFQFKNIQYFVKAGIEPGSYNLQHKTDITFQDPLMDPYKEDVVAGFSGSVSSFASTFYSSLGVVLANKNNAGITIEVLLPSFMLSKNNFSLTEANRYSGFRASIQIPAGKSN